MEEKRNEQKNEDRLHEGGQKISVRPGNFAPPPGAGEPGAQNPGGNRNRNRRSRGGRGAQNGALQNPAAQNAPRVQANGQPQGKNPPQNSPRPQGNGRPENPGRPGSRPGNRSARAAQAAHQQRANARPGAGKAAAGNAGDPAMTLSGARPQGQNARLQAKNPPQGNRPQAPSRDGQGDRAGRRGKNPREGDCAFRLPERLEKELDAEFNSFLASGQDTGTRRVTRREKEEAEESFAVDIATAGYLVEDVPTGLPAPGEKTVTVVGVRFRHAGKVYFFEPGQLSLRVGEGVLVDTARGPEYGEVVLPRRRLSPRQIAQPLRAVLRIATPEDKKADAENRRLEEAALRVCGEKIALHKLDMRLVDAQYTFDHSKLLFYFTSEGRVDFRELVRDLAAVFHTRIELRQIGIRDEARLIGGLGMCGRPFCCATYLSDFGQVSVKMAKEQGLSINTSKISGCCGRLMCCLRYEQATYAAEAALTPKKDTWVETPDGVGTVTEAMLMSESVRVRLDGEESGETRVYHREDVTPFRPEKKTVPGKAGETPESAGETPAQTSPKTPADPARVPDEPAGAQAIPTPSSGEEPSETGSEN